MGRGFSAVALFATAMAGGACDAPSPPLPPVQAESEHFVYRSDAEVFCPLALEWLERTHDALTWYLGVALEPGEKLTYAFADLSEVQAHCGTGTDTGACAGDARVVAAQAYYPHELVHLYAEPLGSPPAFFAEGLAEVLGCHPLTPREPEPVRIPKRADVLELLPDEAFRTTSSPREAYMLAAGFTRFLLDRHGKERFLSFYGSVPRGASADRIADELESAFGESPQATVRAWLEAPEQSFPDVCLSLAACAAPPLGGWMDGHEQLGCGLGSASTSVLLRTLQVAEGHAARIRVRAEVDTRLDFVSCEEPANGTLLGAPLPAGHGEVWADLAPGRYVVGLRDGRTRGVLGRPPLPIELAGQGAPSLVTDECADGIPGSLEASVERVVLRGRFDGAGDDHGETPLPDLSTAFRLAEARELEVDVHLLPQSETAGDPQYDGDFVHLCTACPEDDPALCEAGFVGPGSNWTSDVPYRGQHLDADAPYRVIFEGTPTEAGYMLDLRFLRPGEY